MFSILSPLKIVLFLGGSAAILVGGGAISSNSHQASDIKIQQTDIYETEDALAVNTQQSHPTNKEELKKQIQEEQIKIQDLIIQETKKTKEIAEAIDLIAKTEKDIEQLIIDISSLTDSINDHKEKVEKAKTDHEESLANQKKEQSKLDLLTSELNNKINEIATKQSDKDAAKNVVDAAIEEFSKKNQEIQNINDQISAKEDDIIAQELLETQEKSNMDCLNQVKEVAKTKKTNDDEEDQLAINNAQAKVDNYPSTKSLIVYVDAQKQEKEKLDSDLKTAKETQKIKKNNNKQAIDQAETNIKNQTAKIKDLTDKIAEIKQAMYSQTAKLKEEKEKLPALDEAQKQAEQDLKNKVGLLTEATTEKDCQQKLKDTQQQKLEIQTQVAETKKEAFDDLEKSSTAAANIEELSQKTTTKSNKQDLVKTNKDIVVNKKQEMENLSAQKSSFIQQTESYELLEL